jgi:hypothetical protein
VTETRRDPLFDPTREGRSDRSTGNRLAPSTPAARPITVLTAVRLRWPTWLGIGVAVLIGLDLSDGTDLARAVAGMALIYLGAAALRRPSATWPVFGAVVVGIVVAEAVVGDRDATWVLLGLAVPLVAYALVSGARRSDRSLLAQAIAMLAFGAVAGVAVATNNDVGAYLVTVGLLGHAAWDAYHHWANKAVARSYAECCIVLDALLAAAVVIVTV